MASTLIGINTLPGSIDLSGQTSSASSDAIVLSLEQFNSAVTAAKGILPGVDVVSFDVSAEAVLFVKKDWIRNVFKFKADQDAQGEDVSDNMQFFVDKTYWNWDASGSDSSMVILNPAHAMMQVGDYGFRSSGVLGQHKSQGGISLQGVSASDISENNFMVKHDYPRHMALKLFNVPATDLFSNLDGVKASIEHGGLAAWDAIRALLNTAWANGDGLGEENDTSANICYQLFQQIREANPHRFKASAAESTIDISSGAIQPLPIITGDTIVFTFTVSANADQGGILTADTANTTPADVTIESRTYLIKLCVVDTMSGNTLNEIPDDTYFVSTDNTGSNDALTVSASVSAGSETAPPAHYQNKTMVGANM